MVEAAGVELDAPKFPQTLMCRAFPLILSSLEIILQPSIPKISSISSTKIKKFYTNFTPRVKHPIDKKIRVRKTLHLQCVCVPGTRSSVITPAVRKCPNP